MTLLRDVVVPIAAALLAAAMLATAAQAQTFNPDNTAVSGVAAHPTLRCEGATIVCDIGTANGSTGQDSNIIPDVALTFEQNCSAAGVFEVQIFCEGDVSLIAQNAAVNRAAMELNDGFRCDIMSDLCTLSIEGPQTTQDANLRLWGEGGGDPKLEADVGWAVTRNAEGSELCGPQSGTGILTAFYDLTPTSISIDP